VSDPSKCWFINVNRVDQQQKICKATLRQNKFDQAYQDWVRQLRDAAG
jgi:hypothetical protein